MRSSRARFASELQECDPLGGPPLSVSARRREDFTSQIEDMGENIAKLMEEQQELTKSMKEVGACAHPYSRMCAGCHACAHA